MSISSTQHSSQDRAPNVTVVELNDATSAGENIEVMAQDVVQLQSDPLRARRVLVRLSDSFVVHQSTNLPVRAHSRAAPGLLVFVVFGAQSKGTFNGVPVRPDLLLAGEPGVEGSFVVEAGYESIALFLSPDVLNRHLERRQRAGDFQMPKGIETLKSRDSATRAFFDVAKRLTETAAKQPELFDGQDNICATAKIELLEALFSALDPAAELELTRKERTRKDHDRIVRVAEEYATSHIDDGFSVTELCEAADVSERTLQYAFKDVMGMSPTAFLTRARLHRVRESLRKASNATSTVSAEALRWGFWHFGDFSRAYRNCFGELPSTTLKRFDTESHG